MPDRQESFRSDGSSGRTSDANPNSIAVQPSASPPPERMTRSRVNRFAAQTGASGDQLLNVDGAGGRPIDDLLRGMPSASDSTACARPGSQGCAMPLSPKGSEELFKELERMDKDGKEQRTRRAGKKTNGTKQPSSLSTDRTVTADTDKDEGTGQPEPAAARLRRPTTRSSVFHDHSPCTND
ncbi:hypothetical protein ACRE_060490 [Hapsidospora chrysogenum ATCC 11550]|uniref:Uncharacterized protein n=1 Tax=Hapsidospora chrysogenum (strain ATCC 11550 / CBS 779.69 / DSM 880 / IAM 14645 / JCM 23072 / IMI 49137) TaxID=857340 RepID=A0A086T1F0_HAPC1|nr:hypothetical protein ACRE_060490 [Hapsidospora chrysogenum ATCC 11550]